MIRGFFMPVWYSLRHISAKNCTFWSDHVQ